MSTKAPKKPQPPQALNMTREYRAELRQCRREAAATTRDMKKLERTTALAGRNAERDCARLIRGINRSARR